MGCEESSIAARDARRQADTAQSGKDRGKIVSFIGLVEPEPESQATGLCSTSRENLSAASGGAVSPRQRPGI
jgi:hypothetical protein